MATMHFREARQCVIDRVSATRPTPAIEELALEAANGRVLAAAVPADRDYPATARSMRDGFAVRSEDVPARLQVTGEVRAGEVLTKEVGRGDAVEIMTGAPMPRGADAVVMVEHANRDGDWIEAPAATPGQHVAAQGTDARAGETLLDAGQRIGFAQITLLAAAGRTRVPVYAQPRVALLATGDEIVDVADKPLPHQVRNSNVHSLAAQIRRAGGVPEILPIAHDTHDSIRDLIQRGLNSDLLLISGGVSAGKYDLVEPVLASLGAEFQFDRVLIQPGQPLVFGRACGRFFFGLPGNPASAMVTFEVFARAALELLGGQRQCTLPMTLAKLTADFRHKPGLTRFLPARLEAWGGEVTPVTWHGSGDIPSLARANAFLVAAAERESWKAGELIEVLLP